MAFLDIKDGNGNDKKLHTSLTGSHLDENMPHNVIQEISGSSISSVITALNQISSSVKTGGSVQTVTSSEASPIWITASYANPIPVTGALNVDVQISDLITVTASLSNRVGITGSATINNLAYTSYNASTYTSNVNAFTLVGSSSNRADVDANGSQKVGIFGATNNRAEVDISGSQKVGLFGSNNNRAVIDNLGSLQIGVVSSTGNRQTVDSSGAAQTTGSVTVNNLTQTAHNAGTYSGQVTPIGLVGNSGNRATVDSSNALLVTGSATINNLKDTAYNTSTHTSNLTPVAIVGPSGYRLQTDSSGSSIITSSYTNPVVVTASFSQPLAAKITSSNSEYVNVRHTVPTGAIRNVFSTSDNTINFDDLTNFGAFAICSNNINRKGLTITNPTSQRLFIAIATQASSSGAGRNGFDLTNNTSDPNSYSFVIYPSGSYFADSTNVTLFYGGYFVSSSNALKAMVTETY